MQRKWRLVIAAACMVLVVSAGAAMAEVRLPALFSDHMVVQQQMPVPVWGWASPGEKVTVSLGDQTADTTADKDGRWSVKLGALEAGGPLCLVVRGENTLQIDDVLIGEVWLCSGQSNMAMTVSRAANFEQERAAANLRKIRMFTVERRTAETPQDDCKGFWKVCSPETVGSFSATAFFFGRTLYQELGVPVGLINSSWGGTPIQAWTCAKLQRSIAELRPLVESWDKRIATYDPEAARQRYEKALAAWKEKARQARAAGRRPPRKPRPPVDPKTAPHRPGSLYCGMIVPLAPYAIRGATWYQGEANAGSGAALYGLQLKTMIGNWRSLWGQGDFPFLWVQLPNFHALQQQPVQTTGWVIVREQMAKTLCVPNTGMAITIDIGEAGDIHPKNKQDVGKRLALWALGTTYGKDLVYSGPLFRSAEKKDGKIIVRFDHVGKTLVVRGEKLKGFAIAGPDRKFVFAEAEIVAPDCVAVWSREVPNPVAVRYAWADNPDCNLINTAGLPAGQFRTDDWEQ